jgi:5-methylcytosine-specific restriction endonuclease McrA
MSVVLWIIAVPAFVFWLLGKIAELSVVRTRVYRRVRPRPATKLPLLLSASDAEPHENFGDRQKVLPSAMAPRRDLYPSAEALNAFYVSWEWKRLRYAYLEGKPHVCMCCGRRTRDVGGGTHVDHIKPVKRYWSLRIKWDNLQILCSDCNQGKGSRYETDWRPRG